MNEEVVLRSLRPNFDAGLSGFVGGVGCCLTIIMIAHLRHLVKTVKFVLVSCKENLLWLKTLPVNSLFLLACRFRKFVIYIFPKPTVNITFICNKRRPETE